MRVDYEPRIHDHHLEVMVHDGKIVGVLEVIDRPDHLWIENVAVSPARQGAGLGRRLLVRAEELASMYGHTRIALLTNGAFESNVSLYGKAGYVVDRTEPFRGGITVYMSKQLVA